MKIKDMRFFLKNSGILLIMVGALFLIIPFFLYIQTNTSLFVGWIMIVAGFIVFILTNKKIP
jgi:uncharacterized membrane protein HdeD (DUF308 family)